MRKPASGFAGLLVLMMFSLVISGVAIQSHAARRLTSRPTTQQGPMFQDLQNLVQELSVDHTSHWRHTVPEFGEVITSMSVAANNFDGCSVVWTETQEGTRPGQLFYVETHRFEVPLASMDAKRITVEPVSSARNPRPGIEAGDYYTVLLRTVGDKKTVSDVYQNIVFNEKKGPIASVEQLMVSSSWVRVRQEEKGETLKTLFQQAIASCIAAGQ